MTVDNAVQSPGAIKQCCAALYESDAAKLLMGESFHPGGAALTERLGALLGLAPGSRVLDVASGRGASAFVLAERFGCAVTGVDIGQHNVDEANTAARARGLAGQVVFERGDAERLPFSDASFDAVICECAFCTFPDKRTAAEEFARVLRLGGCVGISDLTRGGVLPADLEGLLSWVACIADAQPIDAYCRILENASFRVAAPLSCDAALSEFVQQMRLRLLGAEIMVGLKRLALPGFDFESAKAMAKSALAAIGERKLGYALITATRC